MKLKFWVEVKIKHSYEGFYDSTSKLNNTSDCGVEILIGSSLKCHQMHIGNRYEKHTHTKLTTKLAKEGLQEVVI